MTGPQPADYHGQCAAQTTEPQRLIHTATVLAEVSHRLATPRHLAELTAGSKVPDDINRAIDAQIDLLVGAYGSERLALYFALSGLGQTVTLVCQLTGRPSC